MAAKYLYVCEDCLEFFSMNARKVPPCQDCGGQLKETDIEYEAYSVIPLDQKKKVKEEYIQSHGLRKKNKPPRIDPPEVKAGFAIGTLCVFAVLGAVGCVLAAIVTMNPLALLGLPACFVVSGLADTFYYVKRMEAMMEDRFYGQNRL